MYGRGCGGDLRLVRWTEGSYFFACSVRQGMSGQCGFKGREAAQHAPLTAHAVGLNTTRSLIVGPWRLAAALLSVSPRQLCSAGARPPQAYPECHYREYPPPHNLTPELSITLDRKAQTVAVSPQLGAEAAVTACGGVAAVLAAAGVDLHRALGQPVVLLLPPLPGSVQVQTRPQAQQPGKAAAGQLGMGSAIGSIPSAADPSAAATSEEKAATAAAAAAAVAAAAAPGRIEPCALALAAAGSEGSREEAAAAGEPTEEGQLHGDSEEAQQPAAGQPSPDKLPAEQAHTATALALQPVVFPLAEYERLHAQLQKFGRQSGICLLTVQGMIPQPTLKSARWVVGKDKTIQQQLGGLYCSMRWCGWTVQLSVQAAMARTACDKQGAWSA